MSAVQELYKNYINGHWVDGGAGAIAVDNPNTGEALALQAAADAADVDRAVQAAVAVRENRSLADLRPVERARMIQKMSAHISANKDRVAALLTLESGKPLWESEIEVDSAARFLEFYGNQAESVEGKSIPLGASYFDFTTYEPYWVSGQIIPWNFPLEITARGIGPALATGNAVVVKTPELDPLSHFIFGEAAEAAGFPAGAVNIVCGHGAEAGAALTAHPDVGQVVFTGSVQTGTAVAVAAARRVVPCVLELGVSLRGSSTLMRTGQRCSIACAGAFILMRARCVPPFPAFWCTRAFTMKWSSGSVNWPKAFLSDTGWSARLLARIWGRWCRRRSVRALRDFASAPKAKALAP